MDRRFRGPVIGDCDGCGKSVHRLEKHIHTGRTYWHLECAYASLDVTRWVMNVLGSVARDINEAYTYLTDGRVGFGLKVLERIIKEISDAMQHEAFQEFRNSGEQPTAPQQDPVISVDSRPPDDPGPGAA